MAAPARLCVAAIDFGWHPASQRNNGTLAADSRAVRTRSNIQTQDAAVEVVESAGKFTLTFTIDGTADVPVAIELAFRAGGKLEGVEPVPADLRCVAREECEPYSARVALTTSRGTP